MPLEGQILRHPEILRSRHHYWDPRQIYPSEKVNTLKHSRALLDQSQDAMYVATPSAGQEKYANAKNEHRIPKEEVTWRGMMQQMT